MKLSKFPLVSGIFLSRPNRFIAKVMIDQEEKVAHVPKTGRMGELFVPGVRAVLAWNPAPHRNDATSFKANTNMDPKFSSLLDQCHNLGIEIRALSCDIDGVNIKIIRELPVSVLSEEILGKVQKP